MNPFCKSCSKPDPQPIIEADPAMTELFFLTLESDTFDVSFLTHQGFRTPFFSLIEAALFAARSWHSLLEGLPYFFEGVCLC